MLDQYYTKPEVAEACWKFLLRCIPDEGQIYLEPSAGAGAFYRLLPKDRRVGLDLEPRCEEVFEKDFLTWKPLAQRWVTVGNPPFGEKRPLWRKFLLRALEFSEAVGFILPVSAGSVDSLRLLESKGCHLLMEMPLPLAAFQLPSGEEYEANCAFYVFLRHQPVRRMIPAIHGARVRLVGRSSTYEGEDASLFIQNCGWADAGKKPEVWVLPELPKLRQKGNGRAQLSFAIITKRDDILQYVKSYDWGAVARRSADGRAWWISQAQVQHVLLERFGAAQAALI